MISSILKSRAGAFVRVPGLSFYTEFMENGAKLVAGEVLGFNSANFIVGGQVYIATPPTIAKLCGAAYFLSDMPEARTLGDLFRGLGSLEKLCSALSWLIEGNESLSAHLAAGTLDEVVEGLERTFDLIGIANFQKLSSLTRSAQALTAKQRR